MILFFLYISYVKVYDNTNIWIYSGHAENLLEPKVGAEKNTVNKLCATMTLTKKVTTKKYCADKYSRKCHGENYWPLHVETKKKHFFLPGESSWESFLNDLETVLEKTFWFIKKCRIICPEYDGRWMVQNLNDAPRYIFAVCVTIINYRE